MSWFEPMRLDRQRAERIRNEIKGWYHRERFGEWDPDDFVYQHSDDPNIRLKAQLEGPFYNEVEVSELPHLDAEERFLVYGQFIDSNGDVDLYYWKPSQRALFNSRGDRLE